MISYSIDPRAIAIDTIDDHIQSEPDTCHAVLVYVIDVLIKYKVGWQEIDIKGSTLLSFEGLLNFC